MFAYFKHALPFNLSYIERWNLKPVFAKYTFFDILISSFTFSLVNIFFIKLQFHFDMIVDIFPAQKWYRLNMDWVNTKYVN